MKKTIFSLILVCSTLLTYGQRNLCLSTASTFDADGGQGSFTWTVEDRITGQVLNGTVASISPAAWGQRGSASSVSITFNVAGNFRVKWIRETKSWAGWTQRNSGATLADAFLKQPQIDFVGPITAECKVRFKISDATFQPGATYTWGPGSIAVTGSTPQFRDYDATTSPTSASVTASTNLAGCPQALGAFLPIPPGVTGATVINNSLGDFVCTEPGTTVLISATNCFGVPGTWNWSASGPISISSPVNSSDGRQSEVTVTYGGTTSSSASISLTVDVGITIGSGNASQKMTSGTLSSYPDCQFLFRAPENNGNTSVGVVNRAKETNSLSSLRLYPNPANNLINLDNLGDVKSVQIYNMTGQLLLQKAIDKEQTQLQLDVSQLQTGSYLVTLVKNDGRLEAKKVQIDK